MDQDQQQQEQPQTIIETPSMTTQSEQVSVPSYRRPQEKKKSKALIIIILLLFLGGGLLLFLGSNKSENDPEASSTPSIFGVTETPEPETSTASPSPTPKAVNKEDVSISILNGTGITGEASYLKNKLVALGYSKIETSNASDQNQEKTTVTFAKDLDESIVEEITDELKEIYKEVVVKTSTSATVDVQIVTGLRKGQTPLPESTNTPVPSGSATPTASPSPTATPA